MKNIRNGNYKMLISVSKNGLHTVDEFFVGILQSKIYATHHCDFAVSESHQAIPCSNKGMNRIINGHYSK